MNAFLVSVRNVCLLIFMGLLVACNGTPIRTPSADQPELISGTVRGQRICGQFTNDSGIFNFVCDPLPTKVGTGWLLTPLKYPHPTLPNTGVINHGAVFKITTPSLTSLEVAFRPNPQRRVVLPQIAPGLGSPMPIGDFGQAEVSASDDGNRKTWTIALQMSSCPQKREIEFVNIDGNGGRSSPLIVHLLRPAAETACASNAPTGSGGGFGFETASNGTPMGPVNPAPSGPCPGNAPRTTFQLCENCSSSPRLAQWSAIEACSFGDVLKIFGYDPPTGKNQLCTFTQVPNRAACEGN